MTVEGIQNTFQGTSLYVGNYGVRSVIDQIMHFYTLTTRKAELRRMGGWDNPCNEDLARGLGRIRASLALVTRDQNSSANQSELQEQKNIDARDENKTLRQLYDDSNPVTLDDIQMPASHMTKLPYDFSGADPKFPQVSDPKFENVFLSQFVTILSYAVRDLSNLQCAESGSTIPPYQSAIIHAHLESAYTILHTQGGSANEPMVVDATDPESLTGKVGPGISPAVITDPVPVSNVVHSS